MAVRCDAKVRGRAIPSIGRIKKKTNSAVILMSDEPQSSLNETTRDDIVPFSFDTPHASVRPLGLARRAQMLARSCPVRESEPVKPAPLHAA